MKSHCDICHQKGKCRVILPEDKCKKGTFLFECLNGHREEQHFFQGEVYCPFCGTNALYHVK